ncbi:hypothetical protein [Arthrobacter sp. ISL-5]|uniref:hypothetical protein n=1 Tax=Arthrobacter sp. ISL-5 TaxID=2819111 RepID=UPI0020365472|nr:hypothetical protein [Arthrobacter sp. ISL-5]
MIEACRNAGVKLGVLFQRRFWLAAQRIRKSTRRRDARHPDPRHLHVRLGRDADFWAEPCRRSWDTEGGGVMINQGIHYLEQPAEFSPTIAQPKDVSV